MSYHVVQAVAEGAKSGYPRPRPKQRGTRGGLQQHRWPFRTFINPYFQRRNERALSINLNPPNKSSETRALDLTFLVHGGFHVLVGLCRRGLG